MLRILTLLLLLSSLVGCSLLPDQIDETKDWSASKLYYSAKEHLADGGYTEAVKMFEKLEARYPYGAFAQQSQLEVAYAYYKDNEPESAIAACDRFIKLHPNHPNVDYAYYLKGLSNFVEDTSVFAQFSNQDMSERDPKSAREAFESFKELATRYPQSKYAADAVGRMKYLVNNLATHEVRVARYYYKRGGYVAAVNRVKYALENYKQSPALEEGLALMARSYDKMNMPDLRDDALRVLKLNFPNSLYISGDGPVQSKSWWRIWD
jgi:outer membrane protein assembly factor BamD